MKFRYFGERLAEQRSVFLSFVRITTVVSQMSPTSTILLVLSILIALLIKQEIIPMPLPPAFIVRPVGSWVLQKFEENKIPDFISRFGTRLLLAKGLADDYELSGPEGSEQQREYLQSFSADLRSRGIAELTATANEQHYEVDTRFYNLVLGKHRKYSSALYPSADTDVSHALDLLDEAEDRMLHLYAQRARITSEDSFRVMDLGCGWGSVTLWFASKFPKCTFVGLSNSNTQREFIMGEAARRGLTNVDVLTGDITKYQLPSSVDKFDRVISIEMFEHMKNYEKLLNKVSSSFLKPKGYLFVHIFVANTFPYHFEVKENDPSSWMAEHFFSGGTMPAEDTLLDFQHDVALVDRWRVNGKHYSLTLEAWLQKMDKNIDQVQHLFKEIYGEENMVMWTARWRAFFFVCSELFKYNDGHQWYVAHYLFQNRA